MNKIALALFGVVFLAGCATTPPPPRVVHSQVATVADVQWVREARDTSGATLLGALAGAYVGHRIAGGRTSQRVIGTGGGAVLGGAAGNALARGDDYVQSLVLTTHRGDEFMVRGVQGDFWPGQRVRVIHSRPVRVVPLD